MRKLILIFTILFTGLTFTAFGDRIAELPEPGKPTLLTMGKDYMYISDGTTIHIYSLKDYKYTGKFGRKGQGPEEMTAMPLQDPMVYLHNNQLIINSVGKVSFYTSKGKYIKEKKPAIPFPIRNMIQPVGANFTGMSFSRKDKETIINACLFSADMQVKKSHPMMPINNNRFEMPYPTPLILTWNDKILTGSTDGFTINIFDKNLNKEDEIKLTDYKSVKMNQSFKERVYKAFAELIPDKTQLDAVKKNMKFKETFPAYQYFYVDNNKLYVLTYLTEGDKSEFYVFDLKSRKLIKRVMMPYNFMGLIPAPTAIKDNRLYQILENEDDEVWELHSFRIL